MAIDMIENNDLGALAKGRLGDLNGFTDENKVYKNQLNMGYLRITVRIASMKQARNFFFGQPPESESTERWYS